MGFFGAVRHAQDMEAVSEASARSAGCRTISAEFDNSWNDLSLLPGRTGLIVSVSNHRHLLPTSLRGPNVEL